MEKFKSKNVFLAGIMTLAIAFCMLFGFTACGKPNLTKYGFNANGEYVGSTLVMDGAVSEQWNQAPDNIIPAGEYRFFRFNGTNGKGYHIEDWDAWDWQDTSEILANVKAYTLINGKPTEYALTASASNTTPITLGEDGYVYIVVHPSVDKVDAFVQINEDNI